MDKLIEFLDANWPAIGGLCRRFATWFRVHGKPLAYVLLVAILLGWIVDAAVTQYRSHFADEIVVLTAARGTSGWRSANRVAEAIARRERFLGVNYTARVEVTDGLADIRDRLHTDTKGNVIGYYLNEGEPPANLRYLLPLDYDYLHIICRAGLIPAEEADGFSHQLKDMQRWILPNRVFAGPPGSETRQLYDQIFRFYWEATEEPEDYLNPAISDWVQARAALKAGTIDVVFFMAPFDTDTMRDIAGDRVSVLLGLADIEEAVIDEDGNSLLRVELPPHAYSAAPFRLRPDNVSRESGEKVRFEFCPEKLHTIAARRLIACSKAMSESDALVIAEAVRSALVGDSKQIGEVEALPISLEGFPKQYQLMDAHEGALKRRADVPPPEAWSFKNWSPKLLSRLAALLPLVLFVGARLIGRLGTGAAGGGSDGGASAQEPLEALRARLDAMLDELERRDIPLSKTEWEKIEHELLDYRTKVRSCLLGQRCDKSQAEVLFQAIRNVQVELEFLAPAGGQAPRRRNGDDHSRREGMAKDEIRVTKSE